MTNKIVILENSVELYEHFIDDDKWERTLAFPRGGVTYLVSNGTIKFFAYEDYLYRNCIISMQLPIYIVDEKRFIDGEYSDIDEITRVLDPIFPSNDITAELEFYLTIADAERLYQPIGDYLTKESGDTLYQPIGDYITDEELVEVLDDYYTKEECDERFQPIGDYLTSADTYTKQEIDDKLDDKLDISAYTPFDPSSYYTKIEVDNLILSGGSFDPSQYYNKSEADDRFALKSEIPSLSGYATQEWVLNQNYVTNSTLQQYITNLQQQITSIVQSISGCCSQTGETLYRWITLISPNDYICSGTTKYEKQQKQQSTDNGVTWVNVSPAEYQRGALLETDSTDCGYTPAAQYRWYTAPSSDYICSGTTKYYKQYYQVSNDGGQTWTNVSPEQTRRGSVIQTQSTDCGYIKPQYRWKAAPTSDYICSGTSKYYKVYYEVSYDGGSTWQHVQPEQTKRGDLIEKNSTDCGYVAPFKFRGVVYHYGDIVNIDCNSSSVLTKDEVRNLVGYSSIEIGNCVTEIGEKAFVNNADIESIVIPSNVTTIQYMAFAECARATSLTISEGVETIGQAAFLGCKGYSSLSIPNSVKTIGYQSFYINKIETLTIGSGVTNIEMGAFQRPSSSTSAITTTVTIYATTPPTMGVNSNIFDGWNGLTIYVPAQSVNAYKTASGWSTYASIIQAIP